MIRLTIFALTFATASIFPLTASSEEIVWQEKTNYIALNKVEGVTTSNHPTNIDPKKLGRILSHLTISTDQSTDLLGLMDNSKKDKARIFTEKEIHNLAQGMSVAFSKAKNDEAVTYTVTDLRSVFFGTKSLSVSGTAFIEDNRLNLIFGEVHVDLHKKYVRSGASVSNSRFASNSELSRFRLNTGNPQIETAHDWHIEPFPGAVAVNNRKDWIQVDLDHHYDYIQDTSNSDKNSSQYLSDQQQQTSSTNIEQRLRKLEQAKSTLPAPKTTETGKLPAVERLRILKSLFENGTITEEVYLEKMRSIVSEI